MNNQAEWVVVFRSMDSSAHGDAREVLEVLGEAGFDAELLDDSGADAPPGSYSVRVPARDEAAALAALKAAADGQTPAEAGDPSGSMDLVTIFEGQSTTAELEAMSIEAVLKANGVPCVVQSASEIPTLPFEVLVPKRDAERALALLAEARAAGPEAAEQAQADAG